MSDFILRSLRGGLNEDPPITLGENQCVTATNVEWVYSPLGERRKGADAIDLTGSDLATCDRIVWLFRHQPTTDLSDAQLWALGITDGSPDTATLAYKDTSWHTVSVSDAFTLDGVSEYHVQAVSLHGKLFLAYNSAVDRLHVWDGTSLRRAGLAQPGAAPTAANTGAGAVAGERFYRVRYVVVSGTTVLRRSEASAVLAFTPSGSGAAVRVTKPATISESETHWELEGSFDEANYYLLARTVVGTTTVDDTASTAADYLASDFALVIWEAGDYNLIPSVKVLSADEDRLVCAGAWEDASLASTVSWTPVYNATGAGNDERLELASDPSVGLDNYDGGPITNLSNAVNGSLYVTKQSHIYQLIRTRIRTRAYEAIALSKQRGAIPGSLVEAFDHAGQPVLYLLDPDIGPYRVGGPVGLEPCGRDLVQTWLTVNLDATVVARGVYFPETLQVHYWIATGASDTPDTRLVLHTLYMRSTDDEGARGGWARWSGTSATALTACLFATNIDDGTARTLALVPFIGVSANGLIWRTDTGTEDNGTAYAAQVTSKPYAHGNLLHAFEAEDGALVAKATTNARIDLSLLVTTADEGLTTRTLADIDLTPGPLETGGRVIRGLDGLSIADANLLQVQMADVATPEANWQIEQIALKEQGGPRR